MLVALLSECPLLHVVLSASHSVDDKREPSKTKHPRAKCGECRHMAVQDAENQLVTTECSALSKTCIPLRLWEMVEEVGRM